MASQPFRVTIIAEAPQPSAPEDATIEAFAAKLRETGLVLRATSIEALEARIVEAWADPRRAGAKLELRIVGHGSSGQTYLGATWMAPNEAMPAEVFADPYYLLDTNPWALGFLAEHRGRFESVSLLSCRAGVSDAEGYAINGRTLTYTLCELLQCKVIGAMDFVSPSDFAENGDYAPPDRVMPSWWEWRPGGGPPVYGGPTSLIEPTLNIVGPPQQLEITEILASSVPGRGVIRASGTLVVTARLVDDPRLLHARSEIGVAIAGTPTRGELFGNGRVLRIGTDVYAVVASREVAKQIAERLAQPA